MCIGTQGHDPAPQFTVPPDNILAGVRGVQSVSVTAGIDFQCDIFPNQYAKDLIQDLLVFRIGIVSILVRTVADDIVHVAKCVKIGKSIQVLENTFKIFQISLAFISSFKIRRIIRISAVYQMDRTDDKIKRTGEDQIMVLHAQIRLESQFHTDAQIDLILVLVFQRQQPVKIFLRIKFKENISFRIVVIHMIRQTEMTDPPGYSLLDHHLGRDAAVAGEGCVYVIIR
jgi:hypothetical protein